MPAFADDLAWMCGQLGLHRPVVVGHSLGGMVGLQLAADHPDVPAAVVALDATICPPEGTGEMLAPFKTRRYDDDVAALDAEWAQAIGDARTARWAIRAADRDHENTYLEIVEFPSYEAAMANSQHPATSDFAVRLAKLCDEEPTFRTLDVKGVMS